MCKKCETALKEYEKIKDSAWKEFGEVLGGIKNE